MMKLNQKGLILPLAIFIFAVLALGGAYVYEKNKNSINTETPAKVTNNNDANVSDADVLKVSYPVNVEAVYPRAGIEIQDFTFSKIGSDGEVKVKDPSSPIEYYWIDSYALGDFNSDGFQDAKVQIGGTSAASISDNPTFLVTKINGQLVAKEIGR
jgi:hypothetical protein